LQTFPTGSVEPWTQNSLGLLNMANGLENSGHPLPQNQLEGLYSATDIIPEESLLFSW
jgi:hypothetical protein